MSKKDYREKIEEHRQSIEIEEDTPTTRLSRSQRRKKKKKSKETPFLTFLTVLLIGIPLAILVYVWGFWEPDKENVAAEKEEEGLVEVQRNVEAINPNEVEQEADDEEAEKANKEVKETEDEEKVEKKESQVVKNNAKDVQDSSSKKVANKNNEQNNDSPAKQKEETSSSSNEVKIHKVSANDTLYSIAKKNYSDPIKGVEKIKAANNLSSDVITPGQELIIPK